jgi:hypothetical protein
VSLSNLKSVFQEELKNNIESFSSNRITGVNDTKLTKFTRPPLSELIGESPLDGLNWSTLYNPNHTPIDGVGYNYPNASRDKLNIRNPQDGRFGLANSSRTSVISMVGKFLGNGPTQSFDSTEFLKDAGKEPYIVSKIPSSSDSGINGRLNNFGGRDFPINRLLTDAIRLSKFLTSPAGVAFALKQNFLGRNSSVQYLDIGGEIRQSSQRFKELYNPLSTIIQAGFRAGGVPVSLFDKTEPGLSTLFGGDQYGNTNLIGGNVPYDINKSFTDGLSIATATGGVPGGGFGDSLKEFGNKLKSNLTGESVTIKEKSEGGDLFTNVTFRDNLPENPMAQQTLKDAYGESGRDILEEEKNGMPFYFKDMRTNAYIFFRAFIEGLTENISPSYAPHNYLGRSEPVWTYERAEREISMTLKLMAQTKEELGNIYKKLDRLTSMCYPEYINEGAVGYGNRMKPPLAKLRYGELYGKENKELMGYIKSISYSIDQSSTYETEVGARVPRHILATIGYQVIHDKAPRLGTKFYGINQ